MQTMAPRCDPDYIARTHSYRREAPKQRRIQCLSFPNDTSHNQGEVMIHRNRDGNRSAARRTATVLGAAAHS